MDVPQLVERLRKVKGLIHGCESLSIASTDGFVLATTCEEQRQGEFLAAVTSVVLGSCTRGLAPFRVGKCRALDFRGERQVLITLLADLGAYLICVLHPGAQAVNVDEPALRGVTEALPSVLFDKETEDAARYFLQRDKRCLIPIKQGFLVGSADHCDLVIPSEHIDGEHLLFQILGNTVLVRDLGTEHGTKLNKKGFTGTVEINPGDRISLPKARGFYVMALDSEGELIPDEDVLEKERAKAKKARARRAKKKSKTSKKKKKTKKTRSR